MNTVISVVVLLVVGGLIWNRMRNTSSSGGSGGSGGTGSGRWGRGNGTNEEENGEQ